MKKYLLFIFLLFSVVSCSEAEAQNVTTLRGNITYGFSFTMDLKLGDTDPDVKELQRVLNSDIDTIIITDGSAGPGSYGKETSYFGSLTKDAVIKFQNKYRSTILTPYGLSVGHGNVDKATRTKLNLLIGFMTTYDSVGYPQSRATVTTPVIIPYGDDGIVVTPAPAPQMSTCQFVELLINIGAIAPDKAGAGRAALGCPGGTSIVPTVDIRINNSNNTLTLTSPRSVTLSWTSSGVTSCTETGTSRSLSGSRSVNVDRSQNFVISCTGPYGTVTDSISVRLDNQVALSASCSATPSSAATGTPIVWSAAATGGDGDYTYTWTGTDGLSSTTQSVTKTYTTNGTKNAQVVVRSDSTRATSTCTAIIATSTNTINFAVNGKTGNVSIDTGTANVSWSSNNYSCTATSSPTVSSWSGIQLASGSSQINFFPEAVTNAYSYFTGQYKADIYSKAGVLLESSVSKGGSNGYASTIRFTKKGGEYPKESYVLLGDGSKCYIADGSERVTSCIAVPGSDAAKTVTLGLSCGTQTAQPITVTATNKKESLTTPCNTDSFTGAACPAGYINCDCSGGCSTYGNAATCSALPASNGPKFLWKPESDSDGKLVILYGSCASADCQSATEVLPPGTVASCQSALAALDYKFFGTVTAMQRAYDVAKDFWGANYKVDYGWVYSVTFADLPGCNGIKGLMVVRDEYIYATGLSGTSAQDVICHTNGAAPTLYHQNWEVNNLSYNGVQLGDSISGECSVGQPPIDLVY